MIQNYYDILEVSKKSSVAEIKESFRRLAHIYHPDKNFGDKSCESKFRVILEAYEMLSDAEKRSYYDLTLKNGVNAKVLHKNSNSYSISDVITIVTNLNSQLQSLGNNEVNTNLLFNTINDLLSPDLVLEYLKMSDKTNKDFIITSIIDTLNYLPIYLIEDLKIKMELIIKTNDSLDYFLKKMIRIKRRREIVLSVFDFLATPIGNIIFLLLLGMLLSLIFAWF